MRIQIIGERQHQRGAGDAAYARQQAEAEAHAHAGEQIDQPMRIENDQKGLAGRMQHIPFHGAHPAWAWVIALNLNYGSSTRVMATGVSAHCLGRMCC